MTNGKDRHGSCWLPVAMLVLVMIAVVINTVVTLQLAAKMDNFPKPQRSLPCAAIPMRLIMEDPVCADKLLRSMNVTNVRVLPMGSEVPGLDEGMRGRLRNLSKTYGRLANESDVGSPEPPWS